MAREVRVKFTGDTSNLERAFRNMAVQGEKAEKTHTKVANRLGRFDEVVGGAVASLETFHLVVGEGIHSAVDLGEQINKTGVVFGKSSKAVIDFSEHTAGSLGISQRAALEAAGTFGNMLVPMGFAKSKAADMSTSLVKLAADMASFNNASPEETLDALRSGLAGETEPLRRFGVFLSQARVQAFALSEGIVKPTKNLGEIKVATQKFQLAQDKLNTAIKEHGKDSDEAKSASIALAAAQKNLTQATKGSVPQLTAAQKAAATYGIVMHDTKSAQGDFTRTSSSLANQQRVLSAEFEDLRAKLFRALLPTLQDIGNVFTHLLVVFEKHTTLARVLGAAMGILAAAFLVAAAAEKVQGSALSKNLVSLVKWVKTTELATMWTSIQTQAWTVLNAVMTANPILLVVVALAALVVGLVIAYKKSETFRNIVNAAFHKVKAVAGAVANFIGQHWKGLLLLIGGPFGAVAIVVISHWRQIMSAAGSVIGFIRDHWKTLLTVFAPWFGLAQRIAGKWDSIKSKAMTALGPVKSILGDIKDFLQKIVGWADNAADALSHIHMPNIDIPNPLSGLAGGTNDWQGGVALVGEHGPEIVQLPRHSRVVPSDETRLMMRPGIVSTSPGGAGVNGPLVHIEHAEFHGPTDAELVADAANRRLLALTR